MKYPKVLFFRLEEYNEIDVFLESNINLFECTLYISSDANELNKLFDWTYYVLVTYGDVSKYLHIVEPNIVARINTRWVHYNHIDHQNITQFNKGINYCYVDNVIKPREQTRPVFSVFTTTYLSYEKIQRAYKSMLNQKMRDWEWIIMDDSPTNDHFNGYLCKHLKDHRIRLYRRSIHSGSIGNVKNEVVSLCRGKYVLELDHDDEITPDCLQNAKDAFDANPNVGFVYMDFYNKYENGAPFKYSDFISFGYGGYYCQKFDGVWQYVYVTPNVNNITAYALIALPNHPRMWRRETLLALGNYSEALPICDDLEILLRTFEDAAIEVVKIHKVGYVQYMNDGNNNFSLIRNREINRLGPAYIAPQFYRKYQMHQKMKQRNAYEDESYLYEHVQLWKRPAEPIYEHKYINKIVNPDYETQVCILGITALHMHLSQIKLWKTDKKYDMILLECNCPIETLWELVDAHQLDIKCYVLQESNEDELLKYFHRLYKSCEHTIILTQTTPQTICELPTDALPVQEMLPTENTHEEPVRISIEEVVTLQPNTEYAHRYEIINAHTVPEQNYLEIGVEYGHTFCNVHFTSKTGVDPSHKVNENKKEVYLIQKMTSDEFFDHMGKFLDIISTRKKHHQSNKFIPKPFRYFDVIFIDGMHQVEYALRDVNNAVKYLNPGGKIFMDDIFPQTKCEQEKIPTNPVFEDGIIKYTEPWTGDVWKLVYYMLQHCAEHFKYQWFHHPNYRGVLLLEPHTKFVVPNNYETLEIINRYNYENDYETYLAYFVQEGAFGA
jgi:glycosyltransferase involved in cell wall biosynthesis